MAPASVAAPSAHDEAVTRLLGTTFDYGRIQRQLSHCAKAREALQGSSRPWRDASRSLPVLGSRLSPQDYLSSEPLKGEDGRRAVLDVEIASRMLRRSVLDQAPEETRERRKGFDLDGRRIRPERREIRTKVAFGKSVHLPTEPADKGHAKGKGKGKGRGKDGFITDATFDHEEFPPLPEVLDPVDPMDHHRSLMIAERRREKAAKRKAKSALAAAGDATPRRMTERELRDAATAVTPTVNALATGGDGSDDGAATADDGSPRQQTAGTPRFPDVRVSRTPGTAGQEQRTIVNDIRVTGRGDSNDASRLGGAPGPFGGEYPWDTAATVVGFDEAQDGPLRTEDEHRAAIDRDERRAGERETEQALAWATDEILARIMGDAGVRGCEVAEAAVIDSVIARITARTGTNAGVTGDGSIDDGDVPGEDDRVHAAGTIDNDINSINNNININNSTTAIASETVPGTESIGVQVRRTRGASAAPEPMPSPAASTAEAEIQAGTPGAAMSTSQKRHVTVATTSTTASMVTQGAQSTQVTPLRVATAATHAAVSPVPFDVDRAETCDTALSPMPVRQADLRDASSSPITMAELITTPSTRGGNNADRSQGGSRIAAADQTNDSGDSGSVTAPGEKSGWTAGGATTVISFSDSSSSSETTEPGARHRTTTFAANDTTSFTDTTTGYDGDDTRHGPSGGRTLATTFATTVFTDSESEQPVSQRMGSTGTPTSASLNRIETGHVQLSTDDDGGDTQVATVLSPAGHGRDRAASSGIDSPGRRSVNNDNRNNSSSESDRSGGRDATNTGEEPSTGESRSFRQSHHNNHNNNRHPFHDGEAAPSPLPAAFDDTDTSSSMYHPPDSSSSSSFAKWRRGYYAWQNGDGQQQRTSGLAADDSIGDVVGRRSPTESTSSSMEVYEWSIGPHRVATEDSGDSDTGKETTTGAKKSGTKNKNNKQKGKREKGEIDSEEFAAVLSDESDELDALLGIAYPSDTDTDTDTTDSNNINTHGGKNPFASFGEGSGVMLASDGELLGLSSGELPGFTSEIVSDGEIVLLAHPPSFNSWMFESTVHTHDGDGGVDSSTGGLSPGEL